MYDSSHSCFLISSSDRVDRAATFELQDPIADPKYWSLLEDALTSVSSTPCARPLKAWLLPLLYRTNLASIVMKLISLSHSENAKNKGLIVAYASARVVIAKLWPLADKRAGMDVLMECFAAVLEVSANWNMDWVIAARHIDHDGDGDVHKKQLQKTLECDLAWICSTIVDSYRDMLVNFGNKKKVGLSISSSTPWLWDVSYILIYGVQVALHYILVYTPPSLATHSFTIFHIS